MGGFLSSYQNNVEYSGSRVYKSIRRCIEPSASPRQFDVFINHRGPDVKDTLALQLYNSLEKMGCRAFLDSREIKMGDSIPPTLEDAIDSASVQIAIFSPRYAQSRWCLDELLLMLQQTEALFIPVFYEVQPWELRFIENGVYANAFAEYVEKGRNIDKLQDWKKALNIASNFKGYEFNKQKGDQDKLCKDLVFEVLKAIEKTKPLPVAKSPVGLNALVEDFETQCLEKEEKDKIIGIFGMGGSGKTTLAKELFNRKRSQYSGSCFLFDVREVYAKKDLSSLQIKLLKDLFQESHPGFQNTDEGYSILASRLSYCPKRGGFQNFLVVVDDIDRVEQLDNLLPLDSLNRSSSLVIVTTRDENVLVRAGIRRRYKMKEMNLHHSKELFCRHAFRKPDPTPGYEDLVHSFVQTCRGLPLSLQVLGGHLFGSDKLYWQLQLEKVRKILPDDIKQRLKISFDALDREEKQIFMDIACFFIGREKRMAVRIWKGCGWSAEHGLRRLKDKCLVEEEILPNRRDVEEHVLRMHDHIRDLGREMADELTSPHRLWRPQDLNSLSTAILNDILSQTSGHSFRCLCRIKEGTHQHTYFIGNSDDYVEASTTLLWEDAEAIVRSDTPIQHLQYLRIFKGHEGDASLEKVPLQLKELRLSSTQVNSEWLGRLSQLEDLVIEDSPKVIGADILISLENLTKLKSLILRSLSLAGGLFPTSISLKNIEIMKLIDVKSLTNVTIITTLCPTLLFLHLENPGNLTAVNLILGTYPDVCKLERIILNGCWKLGSTKGVELLKNLKYLHLSAPNRTTGDCINKLKKVPSEILYLIGRAIDRVESKFNPNFFSGLIEAEAVSESFRRPVASLDRTQCAIIQCIVFESPCKWQIETCFAPYIETYISAGKWIATIVIGPDAEIFESPEEIAKGCVETKAKITKVYTVTVKEGEEEKILRLVRRITCMLYK